MTQVIEVKNLVKHFGALASRKKSQTLVKAVDGVSFSITEGICFGLLGPNGAGKTTTVEMLEGIVEPTSGRVLYRGMALDERFRQRAGIMFQNTALQDYMTVIEALRMFGRFYSHTVPEETLIEQCSLSEFLHRDTRKLSGGQKQRLLLAVALVNDPDVIFLDEPTTGLDPQARRNFWQLVKRIKSEGKTIVLTTHYMDEARQLCDELVFMDHGKVIAQGAPDELLAERFNDVVLQLPNRLPAGASAADWQQVEETEKGVEISTSDIDRSIGWLQQQQVSLAGMEIRSRSLEDLFIELTGKELRA